MNSRKVDDFRHPGARALELGLGAADGAGYGGRGKTGKRRGHGPVEAGGPSKDHTAVYFGLTPLLVSIGVSLISIVGSSSSDSESSGL